MSHCIVSSGSNRFLSGHDRGMHMTGGETEGIKTLLFRQHVAFIQKVKLLKDILESVLRFH